MRARRFIACIRKGCTKPEKYIFDASIDWIAVGFLRVLDRLIYFRLVDVIIPMHLDVPVESK